MVYFGYLNFLAGFGNFRMPSMTPLASLYAAIPLSGALIALFTVEQLVNGWLNGFAAAIPNPPSRDTAGSIYRHDSRLPRDFAQAGLICSLPLITIGAASAFDWMLAYLRGRSSSPVGSRMSQAMTRRGAVLPGFARLSLDLHRLFRDDRRVHFSSRCRAVAAQTPLSGVSRLLQEPERRRVHLSLIPVTRSAYCRSAGSCRAAPPRERASARPR
jgi:hypothetical protein